MSVHGTTLYDSHKNKSNICIHDPFSVSFINILVHYCVHLPGHLLGKSFLYMQNKCTCKSFLYDILLLSVQRCLPATFWEGRGPTSNVLRAEEDDEEDEPVYLVQPLNVPPLSKR